MIPEGMFNMLRDAMAERHKIDVYQASMLLTFNQVEPFKGKRVLEVGGTLPESLMIGEFGCEQYAAVCIDDKDPKPGCDLKDCPPIPEVCGLKYARYAGDMADIPDWNHFDMAISLACFEHVTNMSASLRGVHRAMRKGKFMIVASPIWPSIVGHHLMHVKHEGTEIMFREAMTKGLIDPWMHLTHRPAVFYKKMQEKGLDADDLTYKVYHSDYINRYFAEDYYQFVEDSPFVVEKFELSCGTKAGEYEETLKLLTDYYEHEALFMILNK